MLSLLKVFWKRFFANQIMITPYLLSKLIVVLLHYLFMLLGQRKFILEMLKKHGVLGAKPNPVPIEVNLKFAHTNDN